MLYYMLCFPCIVSNLFKFFTISLKLYKQTGLQEQFCLIR